MHKQKQAEHFLQSLVGMSEEEAKRTIEAAGYTFRLTAKDGIPFIVTCDYNTKRIKIKTFGGKVTSATVG